MSAPAPPGFVASGLSYCVAHRWVVGDYGCFVDAHPCDLRPLVYACDPVAAVDAARKAGQP